MPDIWTTNPEKVRRMISEVCGQCGVESRVLHPRDPAWTCQIDLPPGKVLPDGTIGWDIYLHRLEELWTMPPFSSLLVLMFCGGVLLGVLWGKRFWRARG
jgi:hypothetical protein